MQVKDQNSGKQHLISIAQHPLATKELVGLLKSIGSPLTSSETKILAGLAALYSEMGEQFPSLALKTDLAALYSTSLGVADAIHPLLGAFVTQHPCLALEAKGLSTNTLTMATVEKFATEWSKAFQQVDTECTPVLDRCRELLFLTLKAASKRIRAALKQEAQG